MIRRLLFLASIALNVALVRALIERSRQLTVREAIDGHAIGIYQTRPGGRRQYDPPAEPTEAVA